VAGGERTLGVGALQRHAQARRRRVGVALDQQQAARVDPRLMLGPGRRRGLAPHQAAGAAAVATDKASGRRGITLAC